MRHPYGYAAVLVLTIGLISLTVCAEEPEDPNFDDTSVWEYVGQTRLNIGYQIFKLQDLAQPICKQWGLTGQASFFRLRTKDNEWHFGGIGSHLRIQNDIVATGGFIQNLPAIRGTTLELQTPAGDAWSIYIPNIFYSPPASSQPKPRDMPHTKPEEPAKGT